MRTTRSVLATFTAISAALVFTAISAGPALARGHTILRANFDGIFPLTDPVNPSPIIAGVSPGGAPWVLDANSRTRVREDGRITVVVRHLVIPGRVPGNPIATMAASLVCGDMVVDSTKSFAVSPSITFPSLSLTVTVWTISFVLLRKVGCGCCASGEAVRNARPIKPQVTPRKHEGHEENL